MAELLDALGKPALPYLNGGSGEHSGEPYLTFPTYDLPQPNEVLPAVIVSLPQLLNPDGGSWTKTGKNDYIARRSDGSLLQITPDIYIFSQWASITRYLADLGINNAVENPYQSVQQDDGSPGLNEPQPASVYGNGTSGFMINWLGCRCSWPVTQMMWYQALGCQLHSWAAVVVAVLTLFLEIALLDGLLTGLVRQAPHKTRKYSIENTQNQARDDPIGYVWQNTEAIVLPLVILLLVIGTAFGNSPVGTQYIQSHALLRIQLRSLASRYEGQTYAYCTLVFWCVVTTVKGVIVPAYIVVAIPAIIVIGSSGTALQDAIIVFLIFRFIPAFSQFAYSIVFFVGCLGFYTPNTPLFGVLSAYVVGARVPVTQLSMTYVYLWWTLGVSALLVVLTQYTLSTLLLWVVPISAFYFEICWQAIPWCIDGPSVCPPHTGPCLSLTSIGTVLLCTSLFVVRYGCFLFPCVCAPEVPGWLAFPPSTDLLSPLGETWGFKYSALFLERLAGLWDGADWPHDCAFEPDASNYAPSGLGGTPQHVVSFMAENIVAQGTQAQAQGAALEALRGLVEQQASQMEQQASQIAALQAQMGAAAPAGTEYRTGYPLW